MFYQDDLTEMIFGKVSFLALSLGQSVWLNSKTLRVADYAVWVLGALQQRQDHDHQSRESNSPQQ